MSLPTPIVLFRKRHADPSEHAICSKHLPTVESRLDVPPHRLVVGRYSVLPEYEELEQDLARNGSRLINSYKEHQFIADVFAWSGPPEQGGGLLGTKTPFTWRTWAHLPEGSYVLKGATNSRKQQWAGRMFAPTRADIPVIARRLLDDALIAEQGLVVRQYIPLKQLGEGLNGLPISNEWRTFWLRSPNGTPTLLGHGFYWSTHPELFEAASLSLEALEVGQEAARLIAPHATFFVLDLAETATGEWIVIEVNDGQMSGLSEVSPEFLYRNLASALSPDPQG